MSKGTASTCYFCNRTAEKGQHNEVYERVQCQVCGHYKITEEAARSAHRYAGPEAHLICGYIREQNENGSIPELTTGLLDSVSALAPTTVAQKARRLLLSIARHAEYPGRAWGIAVQTDWSLGYCRDSLELRFFLNYLENRGWLEDVAQDVRGDTHSCLLTYDGWQELESDSGSRATSQQAFVAMWFDAKHIKNLYRGAIAPAIEDAGYEPVLIADAHTENKIDDEILAQIRQSKFVIADVEALRPNVFFEAGFAAGLGIPLIWTAQVKELGGLPFDTRQWHHVDWDPFDLPDFRKRLSARILARFGRGRIRSPESPNA